MTEPLTAFKALSDPARLQIVEFLQRPDTKCCAFSDKVCACDVEKFLGLSQPAVSHHLALLRVSGLIESRREGKHNFYSVRGEQFGELLKDLLSVTGEIPRRIKFHRFTLVYDGT
mgnify:CR=1 FL=1